MKWIIRSILSASLVIVSLPALSVNVNFLNNTATAHYDDKDREMMNAATDEALQGPNGKRVVWKNSQTGHAGSAEALNHSKKHGMNCRNVRIVNRAHHLKDHYVFMFCKHKNGWKPVS